jgi:hypothetical protein
MRVKTTPRRRQQQTRQRQEPAAHQRATAFDFVCPAPASQTACVHNAGDQPAQVCITVHFADRKRGKRYLVTVPPRRMLPVSVERSISRDEPYSLRFESDVPVEIIQRDMKAEADAFKVHGHRNPEGGVRDFREAEYAEVAIKTKYPKGDPGHLSDAQLTNIVNAWVNQHTDWPRLKHGPKRGRISLWTVRRVRKLPRG